MAAIIGVEPLINTLRKAMTFPYISFGTTPMSLAVRGMLIIGRMSPRVKAIAISIIAILLIPRIIKIGENPKTKTDIFKPFLPNAGNILEIAEPMIPPTGTDATKKHLDDKQYHEANSYIQGTVYASNLLGTAIGGVCILYFRDYFPIIMISFVIASLFTSSIAKEETSRSSAGTGMKEMRSAIYFYRKILGFMIVAFALNGLFESIDVYSSGLFHIFHSAQRP